MSRNIESVASIFLEQIHEVERDLENVQHAKESWGSKQTTPVDTEEYFRDEGYEIDEFISDLEEDTIKSRINVTEDQLKEGSMDDIYNLSGTLTSEFETEVNKVNVWIPYRIMKCIPT